jgi:hypothetical protein
MSVMQIFELLQTGGPVAMAAIFCAMWYLERKERQDAQQALLTQSNAMIQTLTKFEGVLDRFVHRSAD